MVFQKVWERSHVLGGTCPGGEVRSPLESLCLGTGKTLVSGEVLLGSQRQLDQGCVPLTEFLECVPLTEFLMTVW